VLGRLPRRLEERALPAVDPPPEGVPPRREAQDDPDEDEDPDDEGEADPLVRHFPASALVYPSQEALATMLEQHGFEKVRFTNYHLGSTVLHQAFKPPVCLP